MDTKALRVLPRSVFIAVLILLPAFAWNTSADAGEILERVRAAGVIRCGIHADNPALARPDAEGGWVGFGADLCRAWSAALFGNGARVSFVALSDSTDLDGLSDGRIDVVALHEDALFGRRGVTFAGAALVDSLALLVRRDDEISNALELDGHRVCTGGNAEEIARIDAFAAKNRIAFHSVATASPDAALVRLSERNCDAVLAERLTLAALRGAVAGGTERYEILPELFSKRLLGPVTSSLDREWSDLIRWSVFALLVAEEKQVNSDNLAATASSTVDPSIKRLLGFEGDLGSQLGADRLWVYRIIETVGNYGEIYARHFGPGLPTALERGPNALWTDGGLLQAPPFQ